MASKLKWAYGTQQQAAAKGVNAATWQKSKDALSKVEKLFADKLQGSRDALKNAILKGRAGNLSGIVEDQMLGYLGDPASATVIAAATPVIIATIKILKESGLIGKNENVDMNSLTSEVTADPGAAAAAAEIQASEDPSSSSAVALRTADASSAPTTDAPATGDTKTSTGSGIMSFIKANPVPAVIGGGLLAFGIYQMVKPKKKATGLSGYKSRKKTTATKSKSQTTKSRTSSTHTNKSMPPKVMKLL